MFKISLFNQLVKYLHCVSELKVVCEVISLFKDILENVEDPKFVFGIETSPNRALLVLFGIYEINRIELNIFLL